MSNHLETCFQISNKAATSRERAILRLAKTMNGEICSPAGEEPDNRVLMAQSVPATYYAERLLHTASPVTAAVCESAQTTADSRNLLLSSLFAESRLISPVSAVQALPSPEERADRRDVVVCALLAENALSVYGRDAYGLRYRMRMRAVSAVVRMEKRVKGWLHQHQGTYQFLTKLGIKRVYVRFKRRKKK